MTEPRRVLNGEPSEQLHNERHWTEVWTLESPAEPALCGLCRLSRVPGPGRTYRRPCLAETTPGPPPSPLVPGDAGCTAGPGSPGAGC